MYLLKNAFIKVAYQVTYALLKLSNKVEMHYDFDLSVYLSARIYASSSYHKYSSNPSKLIQDLQVYNGIFPIHNGVHSINKHYHISLNAMRLTNATQMYKNMHFTFEKWYK